MDGDGYRGKDTRPHTAAVAASADEAASPASVAASITGVVNYNHLLLPTSSQLHLFSQELLLNVLKEHLILLLLLLELPLLTELLQ
jgi:hypothetical protein